MRGRHDAFGSLAPVAAVKSRRLRPSHKDPTVTLAVHRIGGAAFCKGFVDLKGIPILRSIERVPGGLMVVPLLLVTAWWAGRLGLASRNESLPPNRPTANGKH
jgi:hypothetical protein